MTTMTKQQQSQLDSALFKKLQELTMKIPSDPILYKDDIQKYSKMYQEQFNKLLSDIQRKNQRFAQLLIFLSRCVKHFTQKLAYIPQQVNDLLRGHGPNLHPYVRKKCVGSIMILRAKNILYPVETIKFLLSLFNIQDKQLRKILYKYILNDIRRMNKHHKNIKINQQLRQFISENVKKNSDKMTQKSLQLMVDLYKRNIWTDNKSVNAIAEGCFNQSPKIRMIAAYFLISTTQPLEQLSQSDSNDGPVNPSQIKLRKGITKHTKKKEKDIEKQKKRAARRLRKKQIQGRRQNFMPIDVIYSPQDFAQRAFNFMSRKNIKFSHKLIYMALISRLIWRHKLIVLPWYGSLIKYLQPKQKQVHKVLTYFAESVHQNLPDDDVEIVIKHIIQKFVNDKCSEFAMTIGLNTIREVYAKINSLITEEAMLYLSTYYDYRNKNVAASTKALINLVRDINPYLLEKKYRGKHANQSLIQTKNNRQTVKTTIDGAELLEHKGDLPIYLDRILTDQDFKLIRKLKRKQEQQRQNQQIRRMQQYQYQIEDKQDQNQNQQGSGDEDDEEDDSQKDGQQIDWGDCEELEEVVEGQSDGQVQQNQDGVQQEEEDDEEEQQDDQQNEQQDDQEDNQQQILEQQLNLSQFQQVQDSQMQDESQEVNNKKDKKKNKTLNKKETKINEQVSENKQAKNHNKSKKKQQLVSQSDDYESEESDQNPHGFLNVDQIAFYKKSKTQIKAEKRQNGQRKQKFKHKPKQKKAGGTTNRQKQKLKPLMMLRAKKNKIRSQQKQVKLRIKNLKNQLGKVRSGKQAKKLKNKKITKKPTRR